jgi:hypothetical protein
MLKVRVFNLTYIILLVSTVCQWQSTLVLDSRRAHGGIVQSLKSSLVECAWCFTQATRLYPRWGWEGTILKLFNGKSIKEESLPSTHHLRYGCIMVFVQHMWEHTKSKDMIWQLACTCVKEQEHIVHTGSIIHNMFEKFSLPDISLWRLSIGYRGKTLKRNKGGTHYV